MKKERKSKISFLRSMIVLAAIVGIVISLWNILPPYLERWKADRDYRKLEKQYVISREDEIEKYKDDEADSKEKKKDWWSADVKINFEELKKENQDIVAWIRFDHPEELDISYPVLYSGDNEKYLRSDIYGEKHTAGCIFLEGLNQPDFSDCYGIIYGHNMRDGSMFGNLKRYNEDGFYENNQYFTLYTEEKAYRYQIFSYHAAKNGGDVYRVGFLPDEEYQAFIDELVEASDKETGIRPDKTDRILTLSTCTGDGYSKRFVVHAVCVDEQATSEELIVTGRSIRGKKQ